MFACTAVTGMRMHWSNKVVMGILDVIALLGAVVGAYLVFTSLYADSAIATGAAAIVGIGFAVIPYCVSTLAHRQLVRAQMEQSKGE